MKRLRSRPRNERGTIAIIVAVLCLVIFGVAALGVDIASQVQRKHLLKNQLDAAAVAAAFHLSEESTGIRDAVTNAQSYFAKNGEGTLNVSDIDFWCVVARKTNSDGTPTTPAQVAAYQIPTQTSSAGVCNPDAATTTTDWKMSDYQNRVRYDGRVFKMTCSTTLCAVPCALQASPGNNWSPGNSVANSLPITCNTIRIGAEQDVPFSFAPAIGVDQGSTGSQVAVACTGSCGEVAPNPMNVVVVTDRTGSMSPENLDALVQGVKDMLGVMSPNVQFVSLATIGRSKETARGDYENCSTGNTGSVAYWDGADNSNSSKAGFWVPLKFYNDYLTSGAGSSLNTNSNLVKALTCVTTVGRNGGTFLASPLKAAARFSLGLSGADTAGWNVNSELNGTSRSGRLRNVVIFETDGQPYEPATTSCGSASLTGIATGCGNGYDLFSPTNKYEESTSTADTSVSTSTCPSGTVPYSGAGVCANSYQVCATTTDTIGTYSTFAGKCWRAMTATAYNTQTKCQSYGYSWGKPKNTGSNACWRQYGTPSTYAIGYRSTVNTTTTTNTRSLVGGQDACKNFQDVADSFKSYSEDTLLITISFNLSQQGQDAWCSGQNRTVGGVKLGTGNTQTTDSSTTQGTAYLSDILNSSGSSVASSCRGSGSGTAASPYVFNTSATLCKQNVTLVYTRNDTASQSLYINNARDQKITDVLAGAAGGYDIDPSVANNTCATTTERAAENGDGDFFFCSAEGDDLGSVFITALSQVTGGIKLINLP